MPKQKRPAEQASKEVKAIKEAKDYLDWVATLKRPPMTDAELAAWLGIEVEQVPAWKASACERQLGRSSEMARAWRAKAEAGDAKAIELMAQLDKQIADMMRSRMYWATVAKQTG